jgi:hypothetical protein
MSNVTITPTLPLARELMTMECKARGIDKATKKPLDPMNYFMVLFKEGKPGIISMEPRSFTKKYWVDKKLMNLQMEVTFVGWHDTYNGKLADFVAWAKT